MKYMPTTVKELRRRMVRMERPTRILLVVLILFFIFRAWLATQSGFDFHRGWNEGHYSLIARGFFDHPLIPRYGDSYVYNVPPLFPYLVSLSFAALGESVFAARLPSIISATLTIPATYALGTVTFDGRKRPALLGALLVALLPYFQLFGGRAQTDMTLLFFFTVSLFCIVRGYEVDRYSIRWMLAGGSFFAAAFAAKQPAILLPGIVLLWLIGNRRFDSETIRRTGILIVSAVIALAPLFTWFALNYLQAPEAFVATWKHELLHRTTPFADVKLLLAIAVPLGLSLPAIAAAGAECAREAISSYRDGWQWGRHWGPSVLSWWLVLYGAFVLYRTPQGHLYYALPLAPPVALLAGRGMDRFVSVSSIRFGIRVGLVLIVFLGAIGGSVVLYELSGEYSLQNTGGSRVAEHTGSYLAEEAGPDAIVLAPVQYCPPLRWYLRDSLPIENVRCYSVPKITSEQLRTVQSSDDPVFVVYPDPSWADRPDRLKNPSFTSPRYNYTIMDVVGTYINRTDKFGVYLNDRKVSVYRIDSV